MKESSHVEIEPILPAHHSSAAVGQSKLPVVVSLAAFVLVLLYVQQLNINRQLLLQVFNKQSVEQPELPLAALLLSDSQPTDVQSLNESEVPPPIVYCATRFFGTSLAERWQKQKQNCRPHEQQCVFTEDKSLAEQAAAVVFHYRDFKWQPDVIPKVRHTWQRYVFMLLESPLHSGNLGALARHRGFFNWTMTYRLDSDIVYPYSALLPRGPDDNNTEASLEVVKEAMKTRSRAQPVAWFVSNCHTPSRREHLGHALKRHIPVDVFGACGTKQCRRGGDKCDAMLRDKYWFYLALENSICRDYITEKFYRALSNLVVPIVLRDDIYRGVVPEHSYIAADSFDSIEALSVHLNYLLTNHTAYLEYFEWTRTYTVLSGETLLSPGLGFCSLCASLRNATRRNRPPKIYHDMDGWWRRNASCGRQAPFV